MDEEKGISINDKGEDAAMDINNNIEQLKSGLPDIVTDKLNELISNGKLTCFKLDEKLLEVLKAFPLDDTIFILNGLMKSSLEQVSSGSAYLLDIINSYLSAANGPDEEKLEAILERTGYCLEVTAKQRKYVPRPGWGSKSLPGPGCEVFVYNIPKTVFEDKLIPMFEVYGQIWSIRLINCPSSRLSLKYAFITYYNEKSALSAIEKLNDYELDWGKLKVLLSCPNLWSIVGTFMDDNQDQIFDLTDFLDTKPLKLELKQFLDDVKRYETAADFCEMLFEASIDIQELENNSGNLPNSESESILTGKSLEVLQKITEGSSSDQLAETFSECFYVSDSNKGYIMKDFKESFACLLNKGTEKPEYLTCYLKSTINVMESLTSLNSLRLHEHNEEYEPLEKFLRALIRYRNLSAENILHTIFKIHIAKLHYNEEEKKEIGAQMAEAIEPIQSYIDDFLTYKDLGLSTDLLLIRSALQIIYDMYDEFSAGNTTLHEELKAEIEETIKILDELINRWDECCVLDEGESDFMRSVKRHIPQSHEQWWSKYKPTSYKEYYE